ncbi:hypothetical protein P7C70_g2657, partial [Phenoliferia sp. Uapishka_3]
MTSIRRGEETTKQSTEGRLEIATIPQRKTRRVSGADSPLIEIPSRLRTRPNPGRPTTPTQKKLSPKKPARRAKARTKSGESTSGALQTPPKAGKRDADVMAIHFSTEQYNGIGAEYSLEPGERKVDLSEVLINDESYDFSDVTDALLDGVRELGQMLLDPACEDALRAAGEIVLADYQTYISRVRSTVFIHLEAGARMHTDPLLIAAVYEASRLQRTNPIKIFNLMGETETRQDDHLVLVPEFPTDSTSLGPHGPSVHGPLDYIIILIGSRSHETMLRSAAPVSLPTSPVVLALCEAKGLTTMQTGRAKIHSQCLALLKNTGRSFFCGVLTNSKNYQFFVAHQTTNGATVYETEQFYSGDEGADALVISILVEIMLHPGALPSIFIPGG